jgi:hypothetical protein
MSWDRTGQTIRGVYLDMAPYMGRIVDSRVKYGGTVQHTVELFSPIRVLNDQQMRTRILVNENEPFAIL